MAGLSLLNNGAVRELASKVLFENVVQNIMVVPGRSADFRYIDDIYAKTVSVNRVKESGNGREIGPTTNGGYFNSVTGASESELFEIPLTYVFDQPIKVAQVQDDMSGGQALKGMLLNVPKSIARFVNCTYFATILASNLNTAITATSSGGVVTYALNTGLVKEMSADSTAGAMAALNGAVENLGNGDSEHGFDIFPLEESTIYATSAFLSLLRLQTNFIVNNPIGQQMISSGSFSAFGSQVTPNTIMGYQGEVYGMLLYHTGSLLKTTAGFLGLQTLSDSTIAATSSTALDNLMAILVCGRALGGGMTPGDIKVVDARGGQGWEIQPLARCGFGVFSAKGIQTIWNSTGITESDFKVYTGSGSDATNTKVSVVYQPGNRPK